MFTYAISFSIPFYSLRLFDNFRLLTFPPCWLLFLKDPIDSGEAAQLQTHTRTHKHTDKHTRKHTCAHTIMTNLAGYLL